jgi:hypothetical protein
MDAPQVAQMGGAGGDAELMVGLGSRAAAGQAILLEKKGRRGQRPPCSLFVLIFWTSASPVKKYF